MRQTEFCDELDNLVRLDFIPTEGTTITVPFAVAHLTALKGSYPNPATAKSGWCSFASPLLTLAVADDDDVDGLMTDKTKLQATPAREAAGEVFTHQADCPIYVGFQAVAEKIDAMAGQEFIIVATCYDGSQYLSYGVPNTPVLQYKRGKSPQSEGTVTASLKSMSSLILLTGD